MTDVLTGDRLAGRLERLCVERSIRHAQDDRFYLDVEEVERILEIVSFFRHTKGKYAKRLFELMPWQQFFLAMVFGMKYQNSGLRLYRKALLCVPKKNGKSEFAGAIGVLMTYFDGEYGAECYSAANKYDQAMYSWNAAKGILKQLANEDEGINGDLKVYDSITTRSLLNDADECFFKPIAADSKTLDGVNPHFAVIDEYHEAKDTAIPDNMESGMVSREQPLLLITTTRGFNIGAPLWQLEDSYTQILKGTIENENVFPLIFALDEDDDWQDESVWIKANPGLGRTPTVEGLQQEYRKAITEGARREISFRTKNLNEWTSVSSRFIKDSELMAGSTKDWEEADLDGLLCFCGLDLAKTRDITAVAYLFPPQAGFDKFRVLMRYYLPEDNAKERSRQDRVSYLEWADKGWITLTPGNVVDYELILSHILNDGATYDVRGMAYDPWNAAHMATKLAENGLEVREFAQNTRKFNEPIRFLESRALLAELDLRHDPVLRWMFGNIEIYTDGNGNIKFDKGRSKEKIDGPVALAMAFAEYLDYKLTEAPSFEILWK